MVLYRVIRIPCASQTRLLTSASPSDSGKASNDVGLGPVA